MRVGVNTKERRDASLSHQAAKKLRRSLWYVAARGLLDDFGSPETQNSHFINRDEVAFVA